MKRLKNIKEAILDAANVHNSKTIEIDLPLAIGEILYDLQFWFLLEYDISVDEAGNDAKDWRAEGRRKEDEEGTSKETFTMNKWIGRFEVSEKLRLSVKNKQVLTASSAKSQGVLSRSNQFQYRKIQSKF